MKTFCPATIDTPSRITAKVWDMFDAEFARFAAQPFRDGGWILPDTGMDEPSQVGQGRWFFFLAVALAAGRGGDRPRLLDAMRNCGNFWLKIRRPSGRIDLRNCNVDSGPDTAFLLEQIHAGLTLIEKLAPGDRDLAGALEPVVAFARDAAAAMDDAGVHTPNHRWAVASAIALSITRWPDLRGRLEPTLYAFLAEEPDIDSEGAFIERSVAVYDAVTIRSFLNIHESVGWLPGLDAARRNMEFDWTLFHADGTVDTRLSHRYDLGSRPVPISLAAAWLQLARVGSLPVAAERASWILQQAPFDNPAVRYHIATIVAEGLLGNLLPAEGISPGDLDVFYPQNRLVRIRKNHASISLQGGQPHFASVIHGKIAIRAIRAGQSYLGHGRFAADEINQVSDGWELVYHGHIPEYPLGYSQALGERVAHDDWRKMFGKRTLRAIPKCRSRLLFTLLESGDGLRITYESCEGFDGVPAQLAFDFEAGPRWESDGISLVPVSGQTMILLGGKGRMVSGGDWIEVEGGNSGHLPWDMRDFPKVENLVRVAIPLITPFRHVVTLRWNTALA